MQHPELIPPLPDSYKIMLGPGNTIVAFNADEPVLYLDESTMQWCVLDMHISEVRDDRASNRGS